jgi:hypothetical protein
MDAKIKPFDARSLTRVELHTVSRMNARNMNQEDGQRLRRGTNRRFFVNSLTSARDVWGLTYLYSDNKQLLVLQ